MQVVSLEKKLNRKSEKAYTIYDCRVMERTRKSACCDAEIDFSAVFKAGLNRQHGTRVCSNCKDVLYII
jgi:hypothetical protein